MDFLDRGFLVFFVVGFFRGGVRASFFVATDLFF